MAECITVSWLSWSLEFFREINCPWLYDEDGVFRFRDQVIIDKLKETEEHKSTCPSARRTAMSEDLAFTTDHKSECEMLEKQITLLTKIHQPKYLHECVDWDFLEINEFDPEFQCCTCFPELGENSDES